MCIDANVKAHTRHGSISQTSIDRTQKNVNQIFTTCLNWIVYLSDAIQYKREKILGIVSDGVESTDKESETSRERRQSFLSVSETDTMGDHHTSDVGSEDDKESVAKSLYGDSAVDYTESVKSLTSRGRPGFSSGGNRISYDQLETVCAKFVEPFYLLLETLIMIDMRMKPLVVRKWPEIFRLSSPNYEDTQRVILMDMIKSIDNLSFSSRNNSTEETINYLKNLSALLDQSLYKTEFTLEFSVLVIKSIHSLSYKCPPDIRSKLKETGMIDVRNTFIVQCLMDCFDSYSRDLYSRATALCEINSPLQGYITSIETKILTGSHVVLYILSIFIEAAEELEAASNIELNFVVSGDTNALIQRVQMLVDAMYVIIAIVQSCVMFSQECKAVVRKLSKSIIGDKDDYLLSILLKSEPLSLPTSLIPASALASRNEKNEVPLDSTKVSNQSQDPSKVLVKQNSLSNVVSAQTTSSWWGSWSSSTTAELNQSCIKQSKETESISGILDKTNDSKQMIDSTLSPQLTEQKQSERVIRSDDIPAFLDWFCAPEQKVAFEEFKRRVNREIKPILRKTEKIHERNMQRKVKHIRYEMEKLSKEKQQAEKATKENHDKMKQTIDRNIELFTEDIHSYVEGIIHRSHQGKIALESALKVLLEFTLHRLFLI
jgi:hypothetical protein